MNYKELSIPNEEYSHISRNEQNEILIEGCKVKDIVKEYGSPLNIISEKQLRNNAKLYQKVFSDNWPEGEVRIFPAVKANFTQALRNILTQEGCGCDVFSYGELLCALESGIEPSKISLNGNGKIIKGNQSIRLAVEKGVKITIDVKEEIYEVEKISKELNKKTKIRLRCRPDFTEVPYTTEYVEAPLTVGIGAELYKAGLPVDDLIEVGKIAIASEHMELTGAHVHLGRHSRAADFWRYAMKEYAALLGYLKKELGGWEPDEIDIGGGIPCRRDPNCKQIVNGRKLGDEVGEALVVVAEKTGADKVKAHQNYINVSRAANTPLYKNDPLEAVREPLENYAKAITETLRTELKNNGIEPEGKVLEIEPGRAMYGDTGVHVTAVTALKTEKRPYFWQWLNCDTYEHFLLNSSYAHALYNYIFDGYRVEEMKEEDLMVADIVGSSCNTDRLVPDALVPKTVKSDDLIVFVDTAAYNVPMSGNFNATARPGMVIVNDEEIDWIKKPETIEDVFKFDVVPERLKVKAN